MSTLYTNSNLNPSVQGLSTTPNANPMVQGLSTTPNANPMVQGLSASPNANPMVQGLSMPVNKAPMVQGQFKGNMPYSGNAAYSQGYSMPYMGGFAAANASPYVQGMSTAPNAMYGQASPFGPAGYMQQTAGAMMPPPVPSGAFVTPSGNTIVTAPALEESYIENILRLNRGKVATVYMTYENNREWNAKIFKGVIEAAGRDHIILSDPMTGMRYLLLTLNLDYITFDEPINYEYPFHGSVVTNQTPLGSAAGNVAGNVAGTSVQSSALPAPPGGTNAAPAYGKASR